MYYLGLFTSVADVCVTERLLVLVCAILGYAMQNSNIHSLKYLKANVKSMTSITLNIVFSFIYTVSLYPQEATFNYLKIIGSLLVVVAAMLLFVNQEFRVFSRRYPNHLKEDSDLEVPLLLDE